ncbi:MAG: hypothetical protein JWO82_3731 [Akkermansiaceae bacterium]|nr:hypothetical protein [Akkermansiaceae bacterium]
MTGLSGSAMRASFHPMRFRLLPLFALCSASGLLLLPLHAEEIALTDSTVVPGERVGPIVKGMTLPGFKGLLLGSKEKAVYQDLPGGEGSTIPGAVLFKGTDREIQVVFNPDGEEKEILEVRIIGKGWKIPGGLNRGMSLEGVQKVNEKPYKVAGFGWDYGGYADFSGGKLEGKISVRFKPGAKEYGESLAGDRLISSEDAALKKINPTVEELSVLFPVKEDVPKEETSPAEETTRDAAKPGEKPDAEKKEPQPKKEEAPKKEGE